jgi:hypothetical protein
MAMWDKRGYSVGVLSWRFGEAKGVKKHGGQSCSNAFKYGQLCPPIYYWCLQATSVFSAIIFGHVLFPIMFVMCVSFYQLHQSPVLMWH